MKGTEVDERRRDRALSQRTRRERELAKKVQQDNLELTLNGQLAETVEPGITPESQVVVYQAPEDIWE